MAINRLIFRNLFNSDESEELIFWIDATLRAVSTVPVRAKVEIRHALRQGEILIGFLDNIPAGFIFRQHIWKNYYEIGAWTVIPQISYPFTGPQLLEEVLRSPDINFVFFTFQSKIFRFAQRYGAKRITLFSLPPAVWFRLLLKRIYLTRLINILKNFQSEKNVILGLIET